MIGSNGLPKKKLITQISSQFDCDNLFPGRWKVLPLATRNNQYIWVGCVICGYANTKPIHDIKKGIGCIICNSNKNKKDFNLLIEKARTIHGLKFDYSEYYYVNSDTKSFVTCKDCGLRFLVDMHHHIGYKTGCRNCFQRRRSRFTFEELVDMANVIHGYNFDYTCNQYINVRSKVNVICRKCGHRFDVTFANHVFNKSGCAQCKSKFGETLVFNALNEFNLFVERQKTFEDCKDKAKLRFDFFLPELRTIIEYNGIQHFEFVKIFHVTAIGLEEQKRRDRIKEQYCRNNRIHYYMIDGRLFNTELTIKTRIRSIINEQVQIEPPQADENNWCKVDDLKVHARELKEKLLKKVSKFS